jgi:hypothetical protein
MIIVAGDSFVYGSELTDPSQTFPKLLAKEYEDISWPGYANDSIARTTIERCEQGEISGVIVSWTFAGRYEFRFNYDTRQKKSPWYAINSWTIKKDIDSIKDEFVTDNPEILVAQKQTIERARQTGVADFADVFYKHVGTSEYWEVYSTLKEIVYLQNYLTVKQIPFIFTCADNSILYNNTVSNADSVISSLHNQLNQNNWFWFPAGITPQHTQNPRGFYQWAVENKYPIGTTHPLEQAHQAAANLIQEKFNELVKKSIQ